jgi:2-polyprenyl-3-methyl-5-hydroxy-6-metoxy-1,4-benzoquinol methylase
MRDKRPASTSGDDPSGGWEAIADKFLAARSHVGADVVREWSKLLPPGATIVDIGCGSGAPISEVLTVERFAVFGIDGSPTLLEAFR